MLSLNLLCFIQLFVVVVIVNTIAAALHTVMNIMSYLHEIGLSFIGLANEEETRSYYDSKTHNHHKDIYFFVTMILFSY